MLLYRLTKTKYANDLSGIGAKDYGGRWNCIGTPVIYTGHSAALVILEYLPYIKKGSFPNKLSMVILELPEKLPIEIIDIKKLPKNWTQFPAPMELAEIGTEWVKKNKTAALSVPSVHIPEKVGRNYLLNPLHKDFNKIKEVIPYSYDKRLLKNHLN